MSGPGYDRVAALPEPSGRFHGIRRVVTELAAYDFETPERTMRLRSIHPGVTLDDALAATPFELALPDDVPASRRPTDEELHLIRNVIDPRASARQSFASVLRLINAIWASQTPTRIRPTPSPWSESGGLFATSAAARTRSVTMTNSLSTVSSGSPTQVPVVSHRSRRRKSPKAHTYCSD